MKNMRFVNYYLNMKITRDRTNRILQLSQQDYLQRVFERFDMWETNQQTTSMKTSLKLKKVFANNQIDHKFRLQYQFAIESLMYAMLDTRLDIVYAITVINRYVLGTRCTSVRHTCLTDMTMLNDVEQTVRY